MFFPFSSHHVLHQSEDPDWPLARCVPIHGLKVYYHHPFLSIQPHPPPFSKSLHIFIYRIVSAFMSYHWFCYFSIFMSISFFSYSYIILVILGPCIHVGFSATYPPPLNQYPTLPFISSHPPVITSYR